jgi:hypothetical protein
MLHPRTVISVFALLLIAFPAAPLQAQEARFQYQPLDTSMTRLMDITLTIDMVMHQESESGKIEDQSYTSTRTERHSARMLDTAARSFQFTFEEFSSDEEGTDPDERKAVQTLLRNPYRIDLSDSAGVVSLRGDTVSAMERNFVENQYYLYVLERAFSRILGQMTFAVGDSLSLPVEVASSIFQGMQFVDVEDAVVLHLVSLSDKEAVFSFSYRTERSDESALVEMSSTGTMTVDAHTAKPMQVETKGVLEIVGAEHPEANRGNGTITGKKLFRYSIGH